LARREEGAYWGQICDRQATKPGAPPRRKVAWNIFKSGSPTVQNAEISFKIEILEAPARFLVEFKRVAIRSQPVAWVKVRQDIAQTKKVLL
jgi:hypothetical protein